ncbi:MAG: RsmB/NOP family class I SAM-dependent RNA methyltransferase [Gemmatimonadales bacterium]|nr:MAG: RsmB/NOP family class I SAM-dependent RNA methyltransferase [Gemmatimonadales bacterium]
MTEAGAEAAVADESIPVDRLLRYREVMDDWDAFVEASRTPEPAGLRIRAGLVEANELEDRLERQGFGLEPVAGLPDVRTVRRQPEAISRTLEYWLGHFHLQQTVMAVPSLALGPQPGERVLDLCAAPGGKTTHLAQLMDDRGIVVAVDPKEKRLRGLMSNVFRLLHPGVLVVAADGLTLPTGPLFHRVLVDAPCSAEGNFRKQRGRLPPRKPAFDHHIRQLQEGLLRQAIRQTRPGGVVVYSTCTFAPEENEAVVARVLADSPVEVEPIELDAPHAPGLTRWHDERFPDELRHAWRLYPHHLDSGGAFVVRLRKAGGAGEPREAPGREAGAEVDERLAEEGIGDSGWSPIPPGFPGEDPGEVARRQKRIGEEIRRFGLFPHGGAPHHMIRGDRAWACTAREWPVEAWSGSAPEAPAAEGPDWRVVSMGLRAWRQSPSGHETPSSDFLSRWGRHMDPDRVVEPDRDDLLSLLRGQRLEAPGMDPGPVLLTHEGYRLGRGMVGRGGLRSEIPRAVADRLIGVLEG